MISTATSTPNDVAQRLTGRNYLSYSALNTYRACPLRYKFKYVDGLPETAVSASLVFGSAVHRAAELHFNRLLAGESLPELDELLTAYHDAWRDQLETSEVQFGKSESATSLSQLAERLLEAFRTSPAALPAGRILGVEEELRGAILPGVPDLLGRIDLLVETDDAVVIADVKTSRSRWSREQVEDSLEQLLLYSELVKAFMPGKSLRLQFIVLTKTKEPAVAVYESAVDLHRVARTKRVIEKVWRAIEAGHFFPSPSAMQCPTCPFRQACREW